MKSKQESQQLESAYLAYFARRQGDNKYFNFNILPLIKDFSFTDFLMVASKTEHSGILVITDNQYILGYTDEYGIGTHRAAAARIMKDISGGGFIRDIPTAKFLEHECHRKFITARITYDYRGDNEFGTPIFKGAIYFSLPEEHTISLSQFKVFEQFYQDYHRELEMLVRKYGVDKFNIQYEFIDEEGTKFLKKTTSLEEVYTYYESCIDENKPYQQENETIIGVSPKNTAHKSKKLINQ
jgi:hypothetical protein